MQRATGAVERVAAAALVLGFLEVRQHGIPVPADAAALAPLIVIGVMPAYIYHAVDRTGPAKCLAARKIQTAVMHLRLRFGFEFPVHRGIDIGLGITERNVDPGVLVGRPGFQQQDTVVAGFRQTAGNGAAGGASAGNDEVVAVTHAASPMSFASVSSKIIAAA